MTSRSSPPVPNPRQSLQGLLTKDVTPLLKQDAAPVYAALLNSKGRMVHDLILHRDESVGRRHTAIFVDCPATTLEQLKANLVRFKLRSHVTIEDASPDLTIVARWSRGLPSISDCNLPAPPGASLLRRLATCASLATFAACVPDLRTGVSHTGRAVDRTLSTDRSESSLFLLQTCRLIRDTRSSERGALWW